VPEPSVPPPSEKIPGKSSGAGLYLVGIVVLLASAVGLFVWKRNANQAATQQAVTVTATAAPPPPPQPPPQVALPPPPKIETEEPTPSATASSPAAKGTGPAGPAGPGPCSNCQGTATGALSSAIRSTAQSAQGCYQRALRTSEVSGSMTVAVQVSASGSVCSASIAADTVRSGEITQCVLGRFRGKTFPPPQGGCVTVNVPISFSIKQ
jgi:hypothetical protein